MEYVLILPVVFLVVLIALLVSRRRRPRLKPGEILPAGEMKAKYDLTIERYEAVRLDPAQVPDQLRDLVPLAQRWGIGDDIIRDDLHEQASQEEIQSLRESLDGRTRAIDQWLDTFAEGQMSEEAAAFMYMREGLDEMRIEVEPGPGMGSP